MEERGSAVEEKGMKITVVGALLVIGAVVLALLMFNALFGGSRTDSNN